MTLDDFASQNHVCRMISVEKRIGDLPFVAITNQEAEMRGRKIDP